MAPAGGAVGATAPAPTAPPTAVVPAPGTAPEPGWSAPLTSRDTGRKRRRWVPWLIALVVLGALAGLGLLARELFEVPKHAVPQLVGEDEATARP